MRGSRGEPTAGKRGAAPARSRAALPILPIILALAAGQAFAPGRAFAQSPWRVVPSGTRASLRGLSVVNDSLVWASGQRGTVIRSVDGGRTWAAESIPGAGRFDVRAIAARSALVAHAAATAGRIWRTTDGGRTWSLRYAASDTSVFLDAIVFRDDRHGMALGDPIGGRFLILLTDDGGETWREAPEAARPPAAAGEAAFAASGTSVLLAGERLAWIGSGGVAAHVFRSADGGASWAPVEPPMRSGSGGAGVFSLAFADSLHGVAVGGDYTQPDSVRGNAAFTRDGGVTWESPDAAPGGYRSGAAMIRLDGRLVAVAVGTSGSDVSTDGGRTWRPLDATGFNAVQFAPGGVAIAAGGAGRVARLDLAPADPRGTIGALQTPSLERRP